VSAQHRSLHDVVANSDWSDEAMLPRVREWVNPTLQLDEGCYWIVDDTGLPKKASIRVVWRASIVVSWERTTIARLQ
jgi:SRSO17 transposase